MSVENASYAEFSFGLQQRVLAQRVPVNVTVEVTRRCPLACAHCYNNLSMGDLAAKRGELTLAEHERLLDELVAAGSLWLCYTGGEIFARPDFLDIYVAAKKRGFIVTLFTNATLLTPRVLDVLTEWPPFSIEVTLYGRTRETYERLTAVPGSFDRCMAGIRALKERGLPLSLKSVAVTLNKHELGGMKSFAEDELGVPFKFDGMMTPRIDCSASPLAVRLSPEELVALDLEDADRVTEWQRFAATCHTGAEKGGRDPDALYHCGGGINSFAVDPRGRMSICVLSHEDTYDLRAGSLAEGWSQFLRKVRERKRTRPAKCTRCSLEGVCGMCPANGMLENGDPESPVEFLCETAHLRARVFGWPVAAHGECAFCGDGAHARRVAETGARLGERTGAPAVPLVSLPSLPARRDLPSASTGCGGCG